jgi:hypothetical protein
MNSHEIEIRALITDFSDAICNLARVNRLTGLWDHVRFEECKKDFSEVDNFRIYTSEKNSRKNVELRAVHRKKLDGILSEIIKL